MGLQTREEVERIGAGRRGLEGRVWGVYPSRPSPIPHWCFAWQGKSCRGVLLQPGPGGGKAGPHTTHSPALPKASSQPPTTPLGLGIHGKGAWLVPHAPTYPLHTTELPDLHTHLQQLPRGLLACLSPGLFLPDPALLQGTRNRPRRSPLAKA